MLHAKYDECAYTENQKHPFTINKEKYFLLIAYINFFIIVHIKYYTFNINLYNLELHHPSY